ncbi:hypothetical protein [Nonomuraea sp. NPDC049158]|uniref:hypothetical protein n=1 Tax=Nonomuraea sp. NPDC049158 TaxID=3155649 RepID=UPI0033EF2B6C
MGEKRSLPDTIAPGWPVVQVFGTLFVIITLVTARESALWIWALYGVSAVCWLLFVALGVRNRVEATHYASRHGLTG